MHFEKAWHNKCLVSPVAKQNDIKHSCCHSWCQMSDFYWLLDSKQSRLQLIWITLAVACWMHSSGHDTSALCQWLLTIITSNTAVAMWDIKGVSVLEKHPVARLESLVLQQTNQSHENESVATVTMAIWNLGDLFQGENTQIPKEGYKTALWSGKYLKYREVIVDIISTSPVNCQLTVLNPGRLGDTGCICCTPPL